MNRSYLYPCAVTRNANEVRRKPIVFLWHSDCAFAVVPRGVRWGCAKESLTLWTFFI